MRFEVVEDFVRISVENANCISSEGSDGLLDGVFGEGLGDLQ